MCVCEKIEIIVKREIDKMKMKAEWRKNELSSHTIVKWCGVVHIAGFHPSIYLVSWSFEFWSVEKIRLFVCLYTFKRCICWWFDARFCSQFANYSFRSHLCRVLLYICALKIEWFWNEHFRYLLILNIQSDAHFNFKMHIVDGLRTIVI